jgi:hypothetical protein
MDSSIDSFGIKEDFQQLRGQAHEQELMIFVAVEYDAGASLHVSSQPATSARTHSKLKGGTASFEFELNVNLMCLGC